MRVGQHPAIPCAEGPDAIAERNFWSADRIAARACPNFPLVTAFRSPITSIGSRTRLSECSGGTQGQQEEYDRKSNPAIAASHAGKEQMKSPFIGPQFTLAQPKCCLWNQIR